MTVACVLPAVAVPIVGAPGTTGFTVNDCGTWGAGRNAALPAWFALMVHVPPVTNVRTPPDVVVHTPVVDEENVTVSPDEAVAVSVGLVPKLCEPGLLKVMVCVPIGVTAFDAADAALVPIALVAVTVQVYVVPLASPDTTMGDAVLLPLPPGLQVAL